MTSLLLPALLNRVRSSVESGEPVRVRTIDSSSILIAGGQTWSLAGELPSYPIVGCDLKKYSGLTDLEQFVFGAIFEVRLRNALRFAGVERKILGANGTGDGVLMSFDQRNNKQALLFAMRLWWEGRRCIFGEDQLWRGIRVAFSRGPCLLGKDRDGTVKMQGFGLIENARVLSYDKETHFLVSKKFWHSEFGNVRSTEFSSQGWTSRLRIAGTVFQGKAKPGDRHSTAFYNLVGTVARSLGKEKRQWRIGCLSAKGLSRPS